MTSLLGFFNDVVLFLNDVSDFHQSGIYQFFKQVFAQFIIYSTVAYIEFKIFMLGFAYDVAKEILNQLSFSTLLSQAWGSIDSNTAHLLGFFKIPEAINIVLSAKVTKFVLKFIGL